MSRHISENLLQEAWANRAFRLDGFKTQGGLRVDILSPGSLNRLSGPDFKDAKILIDGIIMYGDIEIHHFSDDWERHLHHRDPAYNNVILHIALDNRKKPLFRNDLTSVPHVNIASRVEPALRLSRGRSVMLPCTTTLMLKLDLAEKQLLKASDHYFNELVQRHLDRLKRYSDYTNAWQMALFAGFCSVLGAPGNREPMETLSASIWTSIIGSVDDLSDLIHSVSGWKLSAGRPASRPHRRITQAYHLAQILKDISEYQFKSLPYTEIITLIWKGSKKTSSQEVMIATVLLPALWVSYSLENNASDARKISSYWKTLALPLSPDAQKFMWKTKELSAKKWNKSFNWQYRSMCIPRRCADCYLGAHL